MEIQRIQALRGVNIWARFPVLEAWVALHELKEIASSEIPGFNDRLKAFLPTLVKHRCSEGTEGGFFARLERGTYLAHILEHVVLELQSLAGTEVGYGKTRLTNQDGVYKIGIEYTDEEMGRLACELGRDLCMAAVQDTAFDVEAAVSKLRAIVEKNRLSPIATDVLLAAKKLGVPAMVLDPGGLLQLGQGAKGHRILDGQTDRSSGVGVSIAYDRQLTREILHSVGVPTPWGRSASSPEEAWTTAEEMTLPVVLRPRYVKSRKSPIGPASTQEEVTAAFDRAYQQEGWTPLIDHVAPGDEYRLLMVGGRLVAALDANGVNVADKVGSAIVERAADALAGLRIDVAEVEIVAQDLSKSLESQGGVVLGVVAPPHYNDYLQATNGSPNSIGEALVQLLYPEGRGSRIPVVSVTGTNGKTTTTRLAAHLLGQVWAPVGMTCTEGIWIGDRRITKGDCSGPKSAKVVLQHSQAKAAAVETARGGILREGLGFDRCDVAIVTNIEGGDHLGASDIDTAEQLAYVKATTVWGVAKWGAAVLNAADPLVVNMKQYCDGSVIYFALSGDHPVVAEHRASGGRAVFTRSNRLILADGSDEIDLLGFEEVPLTQGGRVGFHVENALAATAAAWFLEVPLDSLRNGLRTFRGGMDQAPARFNLLNVQGVSVVLDYGHNVSALHRLLEAMKDFPHPFRTVVYSAAGDRRDSDIIEQGELLGQFFDRVILYEDTYLRGRKVGEISSLFGQGIARGGRATEVRTIIGGMLAIEEAMAACAPGDLLVVQPDRIDDGVALLKQFLSKGGREVTMSEMLTANPKSAPAAEHAAGAQVEIRENHLGKAAYAGRAFRAGELIASGWGPTTTVRSMHTIQIDVDLHLVPPSPIRFFNHACEPNCGILIRSGVEGLEIHALRDIDEGEEMTLDYETFEVEFQSLTGPCLCSTDGCRGSLKGYKGLPKDLREYYGQYIAQYLRDSKIPAEKRQHANV